MGKMQNPDNPKVHGTHWNVLKMKMALTYKGIP